MLIAARNAMMAGGGWKNPYVTDGLFAWWDGIGGQFSLSDIISGALFSGSYTLNTDGSIKLNKQTLTADFSNLPVSAITMEIIFSVISFSGGWVDYAILSVGKSYGIGLHNKLGNYRIEYTVNGGTKQVIAYGGTVVYRDGINSVAVSSANLSSTSQTKPNLIVNDTKISNQSATGTATYQSNDSITLGSSVLRMNVYSLRLYSRALTAEEIAANYAVDKARFGLP